MLKGKRYEISDSFDGHGQRVSGKTLTQHNLDSAKVIAWTPVTLLKQFLSEAGELERFQLSILGKICKVSDSPTPPGASYRSYLR